MNPWRGLEGLPRDLWIVCGAVLINRSGMMVLPFLALYLTGTFGFSAADAGFTITLYGLGALVTAPVAGRLCDRVGPLVIMRASLFLSGTLMFVFPHVSGRLSIMVATVALAILGEGFRPASMTILTELSAPDQRKAAFALLRLAINLGMSVGPAVGGFLTMLSFPALFYVDGATSILAGLVLSIARFEKVKAPGARASGQAKAQEATPASSFGALADRRLMFFLTALVPVLIVFFQHQTVMPLFLVRGRGMPASHYGLLFTINTGLIILLEVPLNLAMAAWRHRLVLPLGAVLVGAGFGALALAGSLPAVALTVVIWTFGEMILLPASNAYVSELAPPERRGQYMGLYVMSFSVAFTAGPWLGAQIYERFGSDVLWGAVFLCGCLSAAMMSAIRE